MLDWIAGRATRFTVVCVIPTSPSASCLNDALITTSLRLALLGRMPWTT
jgi:hypothetical protein